MRSCLFTYSEWFVVLAIKKTDGSTRDHHTFNGVDGVREDTIKYIYIYIGAGVFGTFGGRRGVRTIEASGEL